MTPIVEWVGAGVGGLKAPLLRTISPPNRGRDGAW